LRFLIKFMKADVYNKEGQVIEQIELPLDIFKTDFNPDLVHQVLRVLLSRRRLALAFAKGRSEVRGGGKKPWRQKGTGRARHGSIRSPLWKGGGVTSGPRLKEENFKKRINKKMRKAAIKMVLSQKIKDKEIKIFDSLEVKEKKTKMMDKILKNILETKNKKQCRALVLLGPKQAEIKRILKNIPYLNIQTVSSLDLLDLLNNKYLVFEKNTLPLLIENLTK